MVHADEQVTIAEETLKAGRRTRPTHSELLGGKNNYGAGELIFAQFNESFNSFFAWGKFIEKIAKDRPTQWYLDEINNSSGHYLPDSQSLPYVAGLVKSELALVGIDTSRAQVIDRLVPGLRLRGAGVYWAVNVPFDDGGDWR